MLKLYTALMQTAALPLRLLLLRRQRAGKEDATRLAERMGEPSVARPAGKLIWLHAASVGEAQSILSLAGALLQRVDASLLITSGTVNSAKLLAQRLPPRAVHQYYPVDRPAWTARFLDHWQPDLMLWTESELWPSMLLAAQKRGIPAVLVNGRLSERSFRRWRLAGAAARQLLNTFSLILAQTDLDRAHFVALGAPSAVTAGNLKYSAAPLPVDENALSALHTACGGRPVWLYASTHAGEEVLAARLHQSLRVHVPSLLTIIVPRHPARAANIVRDLADTGLPIRRRGEAKDLPASADDIYIADTIGELGLFYRAAPVACIGRSFSDDGGGGHNPLEAAQLGCAVLYGPAVQNQTAIYAAMNAAGAAIPVADEAAFGAALLGLLTDTDALREQQERGRHFVAAHDAVLNTVLDALGPLLARAGLRAG